MASFFFGGRVFASEDLGPGVGALKQPEINLIGVIALKLWVIGVIRSPKPSMEENGSKIGNLHPIP